MTEKTRPPDRIKPFYEMPQPGQDILLIKEDEAILNQDGTEFKGTAQITQEWSPMVSTGILREPTFDAFNFGEVELESKSFTAIGRLFSQGKHRVAGYIEGKVELGSDHKLGDVELVPWAVN